MVSVIIPAYNREKSVADAINSVLGQTWRDLELILVDDGSTDNTAKIVCEINDPRLKYVYQANAGACAARNHGIELAAGEFIAFHDSDDVWHKDKLEKQMNALLRNDADIVFCKLAEIKQDGSVYLMPQGIREGFLNPVVTLIGIGTQTILAKRKVFEQFRFDRELPRFQEFELMYRASKVYSVYCVDEGLVDYYIGADSISSNPEKLYQTCELILRKHPELPEQFPKMLADMGACLKQAGDQACRKGDVRYKKYILRATEYKKTFKMKIVRAAVRIGVYPMLLRYTDKKENVHK